MTEALEKYQENADEYAAQAMYKIQTKEEAQAAANLLVEAEDILKKLEAERKDITRPMREALEKTNALFSRVSEKYEIASKGLRVQIGDYQEREKDRERKLLAAAAAAETTQDMRALVDLAGGAAPVLDGVGSQEVLTITVTDITKVPHEFLRSEVKVREVTKAWKDSKGTLTIPGLVLTATSKVRLK